MTKLTLETIKRRLRRYKPETSQAVLRKCQFPLLFVDEGMFRVVYRILGTEYVLKMPIQEWEPWRWKGPRSKWIKMHINHARLEMNAHTIISTTTRPAIKALAKYLPEVPYMDWDTGVTLMRHYRTPTTTEWNRSLAGIYTAVEAVQKRNTDIKPSNCGVDSSGKLRIVDLGCFKLTRDE